MSIKHASNRLPPSNKPSEEKALRTVTPFNNKLQFGASNIKPAIKLYLCFAVLSSNKMTVATSTILVSSNHSERLGETHYYHQPSSQHHVGRTGSARSASDELKTTLANDVHFSEWPRITSLDDRIHNLTVANAMLDLGRNQKQQQQYEWRQHDRGNNTNDGETLDVARHSRHLAAASVATEPQANNSHLKPSTYSSPVTNILDLDRDERSSSDYQPVKSNKTLRSVGVSRHAAIVMTPQASAPPALSRPIDVLQQQAAESSKVEHDPDCALILKRTYIMKAAASNKDEWGDKFVFNDVDPDDAAESQDKKKVHKTDLCIKHSDVDKAFQEAKHRIKFEKPQDMDNLDVSERSLASIGELSLATGLLLTKRFELSPDEILNALPMIDMSASKHNFKDLCPKHVSPMVCMKSRYRTITGHCNNLKHPAWGASKTPYSRYLPPDYADGLSLPRASRSGQPLPSARLVSSQIHVDADEPSHDYSMVFADWGQLLNHDITRVAVGEAPDCCPQLLKGLCMPIPVPEDDPLYSKFNVKCLKFDRSLAAIRPKCLLGHRAQINLITSSVDASFVYGSTKQQANKLRTFSEGKMKVWNYFEKLKLKPLLPPKLEEPDKDCLARPKNLFCFEAGDVRVNEQTHLTTLHVIYLREHNRIAKQLAKINLEWDDERLYHETRHIVAACVQHVMANEFWPLLLGNKHIADYQFKPSAGYWNGYDPRVTISTGTAFASAAFRYGHSMIEGTIRRLDPKTGAHIKSELLRFLFKRPFMLYEPGAVDELLAGMLLSPAEHTDPFVSEELSGHLFQPPKAKFGHDLAAINIQRGRDQGVPGYNDWREWCGFKRAKSFSDLEPLLMNHTAWHYSKIYKHVDDIDLWSAGISERKMAGSAVGPTLGCIISRQFLNYKRGDRFWYENPGQPSSFTPAQLREIKKMTLAKIMCTNADDLPRIQPWAMRLPHPIYNAKVSCDSLPTINFKHWDSSQIDNI